MRQSDPLFRLTQLEFTLRAQRVIGVWEGREAHVDELLAGIRGVLSGYVCMLRTHVY
jgi:hypothetical protein